MSRLEHQNRTDPAAAFEDLFEDDGWDDFPSNYLKLVAYFCVRRFPIDLGEEAEARDAFALGLPAGGRLFSSRRNLSQLHARLIAVGELDAGGLEVRRASRRSDLPAMLGRKGSEKCMVTTTTDLIEDSISVRLTLQRQLKMLESDTMPREISLTAPQGTQPIRVRRCIDELNSLLKEYARSPKP